MGRSIAFAAVLAAAGALGTEVEDSLEANKYGKIDEASLSLVQLYFAPADAGRWRERRLLESEFRGSEDNPVLQKRLADMLHKNGKENGNLTKTADKRVAAAPAAPVAQEPSPPESLAQESAALPEALPAPPPARQPSPPEGWEQLPEAPAAPAVLQPRGSARQPEPPLEAGGREAGAAAEQAALAAAEKEHWEEVAREAQEKAAQAAKEEAKWEALAQEGVKEAYTMPQAEGGVGHRSDATPARNSEAKAEANQEAKAQAEAKQNAEAEAKQKAESNANMEAEAKATQVKSVAEARQNAEMQIQAKTEAEAQALAEAEARAEVEAKSEAEAKQNAEAEAKQKAESNANTEAEAEATQVKTVAEAQQKTEIEIQAKTEAEAQALAEAEAQAEAEAKAKSEAEAKQKAEAEAKQRAAAEAEAEAKQKAEAAQKSLVKDKTEVESIVNSWEQARVCVRPEELNTVLEESKRSVLAGLPEWQEPEAPSELADVTIAFLIQASWEEQLPVLRRTFDRLYTPKDLFLYTVDRERMDVNKVVDTLPKPLPFNVAVKRSAHSDYYVWPRVEIVLDGLRTLLLNEKKWDFVIHLSESDYPVHSLNWIRQSLAAQRKTNFIQIIPRCGKPTDHGLVMKQDDWYWWTQDDAMASCGPQSDVTTVDGVKFPLADFDRHGFRFAHGAEWMVVTRELVKYALSPKLLPYRKLIGMHVGADEIFWQTLVLNIPKFEQKVSPQGWYLKWGHGKTDHSPDTLTKSYEDEIMRKRQNYFFIRKVSATESPALLDDIDRINQGDDAAPGPALTQTEEWSAGVVPCGSSYHRKGFIPRDVPMPPHDRKGWQGTKSRKQLLESYKWYMENQ